MDVSLGAWTRGLGFESHPLILQGCAQSSYSFCLVGPCGRNEVKGSPRRSGLASLVVGPRALHGQHVSCSRGWHGVGGRGGGYNTIRSYGDHAQDTGIYSAFESLHNILHKDVEQDTSLHGEKMLDDSGTRHAVMDV